MTEILDLIPGWIEAFLQWVQSIDPVLRTVIAGVAIMLETSILIGLVVPGDTIVIAAGLGVQNPIELAALILAVLAGALVGESIGFLIGRLFGPWLRASALGRRIGEKNWQRADSYLERRGGWAIFVSRFLPVLHALVPVTVGMSTMRYRRFLAWTAPACILWSLAYGSVGYFAASAYDEISDRLHYAGYFFVGGVILVVVLLAVGKKLISRREERFMADAVAAEVSPADAPTPQTTKGGADLS